MRGGWPDYADQWRVTVDAIDLNGGTVWSETRSGTGTEYGEDVHMQWDEAFLKEKGDFEKLVVTLEGTDTEYWAGNYGVIFRGMDLYMSEPTGSTMLASKAASSSGKKFNAGFMAGLGASAAVMGVGAFVMLNRKKSAIEDGAF